MSMNHSLTEVIDAAMSPLVRRFGLEVVRQEEGSQYAAILYANATTGLEVAVARTDMRPFLMIYELENGKIMQEIPIVSGNPNRIKGFDVDGLLLVRAVTNSPVGKMFSEWSDRAIARLLGQYATVLGSEASDVLTGNFEIFPRLDALVRDHARELDAK